MKLKLSFAAFLLVGAILTGPGAAQTEIEGTDLTTIAQGEGRPMVFVHGSISDHRVWLPLADPVSERARFVAYDQRYFGQADWPKEGASFSIGGQADDLIRVVEALDAGPVDLVTWSSSGEVGLEAMILRPDLFHAAIHYEPVLDSLLHGVAGAESATREMFSTFGPAMTSMKAGDLEATSMRFLEAVFRLDTGAAETEPPEWQAIWKLNGRTIPGMLAATRENERSCEDLSKIAVPTLVVRGQRTWTRYAMMSDRVVACLPNALSVTMSGVNHDGPYREPENFARLATSFADLIP